MYTFILQNAPYILLVNLTLLGVLFKVCQKRLWFQRIFILVTILYNAIYLVWRTVFTLPLRFGAVSILLGIILLLAELLGFWQSLIFRMLFWKPFDYYEWPPQDFVKRPTVDIFIATYNESMRILRKTIVGCQNIDYPADCIRIYLCDDGRREEARRLCEELGVGYITRPDNAHAKAGNINNALNHSNGEFVMLLDADMVPKTMFLRKTIGYFVNEKIGFVQTPQAFYNADPFQYNLKLDKKIPNEQDFFMMDIQGGRDNYNAVLHVGTNAVFRRTALEEIGGVPTGTITEDMATGMLLQARGYETKFVKEVLCTGLSVESFADLVRQRERWCRGNIQVVKRWNPLRLPDLTLAQRLIYIDGLAYWFFGVQKMIYLLCPLLYLIFGVVILDVSARELLLFWLPSFSASVLTFRALVKNSRTITWSHIYEVAMAPYLALAALVEAIFARPIPFRVTPKGTSTEKSNLSMRVAMPHIWLLLCSLVGWAMIIPRLWTPSPGVVNAAAINIAWSIYNVFALIASILVCWERPRKRGSERIAMQETTKLSIDQNAACKILDLSETGAKVECESIKETDPQNPDRVSVFTEGLGEIEGQVVWSKKDKDKKSFGIQFSELTHELYSKIVTYISDHSKGYHDDK